METKSSSLRSLKICRFCLTKDEHVSSIFDKKIFSSSRNSLSLTMQIMACISVEVFPSDGLPCHICERCRFFMDTFYHFKLMCRQADEQILLHIEDRMEHLISPLPWPKKLTRLYNALQNVRKKSNKVKTVKTESGATVQVQVTANDLQSESDADEEENTFKISIDDNFNDDPACIKLVKSNNTLQKMANQQIFFNPIAAQSENKKYNCTICNKVFTSHTYYTRHMSMRHKSLAFSHGPRGPFGDYELYRCDQCDDVFQSQDGLIYHSAKHATENLTCPLCQEKFDQVEEVSEHIKTHVDGAEFMCDLCELVFTTKEKLDQHLIDKHSEELRQEQELGLEDDSMEEEDEDDNIRIKEENGETVVEVTHNFVNSTPGADVNYSEESEPETLVPDPMPKIMLKAEPPSPVKVDENKPVSILKKVEEMKRKSLQKQAPVQSRTPTPQKQTKPAAAAKVESSSPAATADKSLRLLEKELQELKRTNTNRAESIKPAAKNVEPQRPKRAHTVTPKARPQEEKKLTNAIKPPAPEKKPERRVAAAATVATVIAVTKENKEPKESKETKTAPPKEDKVTDSEPEKEKESKETPNAKASAKNNTNDDRRRSSRSGKVKDYAKMINDKSSDDSTDDDEEYTQAPTRSKKSTGACKATPQPSTEESPVTPGSMRKRGRPRKGAKSDAPPSKVMKPAEDEGKQSEEEESEPNKNAKECATPRVIKKVPETSAKEVNVEDTQESTAKEITSPEKKSDVIKSPSGQTLKKVPIKALPPGVKPLPLPTNARSVHPGELCEMQIGKKMVKVQKIVMTKAEVEAMAKKGLVEVKHGTMVLKQGIKLPTSDSSSLKSTLISEANKDNVDKNE